MKNRLRTHATAIASASTALLLTAQNTFAQDNTLFDDISQPDVGFTSFGELINRIVTIVFIIGGLAVLIYLFMGAFTYLTAGDSEENTKKARQMITNAVVGLIILASSWAIWQLIISFIPGLGNILGQ